MANPSARRFLALFAKKTNFKNFTTNVGYCTQRRISTMIRKTWNDMWRQSGLDIPKRAELPSKLRTELTRDFLNLFAKSETSDTSSYHLFTFPKHISAIVYSGGFKRQKVNILVTRISQYLKNSAIQHIDKLDMSDEDKTKFKTYVNANFVKRFKSYGPVQFIFNIQHLDDLGSAVRYSYKQGSLTGPLSKERNHVIDLSTAYDFDSNAVELTKQLNDPKIRGELLSSSGLAETAANELATLISEGLNATVTAPPLPTRVNEKVKTRKRDKVRKSIIDNALPVDPLVEREDTNKIAGIFAMINARLFDTVADQMGGLGLQYRTGRFARSAQIHSVTRARDDSIFIQYKYQMYPYATFEPEISNTHLADRYRDPKRHIGQAIRTILVNEITSKLILERVPGRSNLETGDID